MKWYCIKCSVYQRFGYHKIVNFPCITANNLYHSVNCAPCHYTKTSIHNSIDHCMSSSNSSNTIVSHCKQMFAEYETFENQDKLFIILSLTRNFDSHVAFQMKWFTNNMQITIGSTCSNRSKSVVILIFATNNS